MKNKVQSKEEFDKPEFTDAMFNSVAGSCFETGTSLAILDHPGQAGEVVDQYALQLDAVLSKVYETDLGLKTITVPPATEPITIRDFFNSLLLDKLSPDPSNGIARNTTFGASAIKDWLKGDGIAWLHDQLTISSKTSHEPGSKYTYKNMLTKIGALSVMGDVINALAKYEPEVGAALFNKDVQTFSARTQEVKTKIRHAEFGSQATRKRVEKEPLLHGRPLSAYKDHIEFLVVDGNDPRYAVGTGGVYHEKAMIAIDEIGEKLIAEYENMQKSHKREGMPRLAQDVLDKSRVGILGESSTPLMPEAFQKILPKQLEEHQLEHGSGLNRWWLQGSYTRETWDQSLPAAGAHSGSTADVFLTLNCLDEAPIFGQEDAKKVGLLISSFMNVGGYHTFVETFPIAKAVANDEKFKAKVTVKQKKHLYEDMVAEEHKSSGQKLNLVQDEFNAYKQALKDMKKEKIPPPTDLELKALDLAKATRKDPSPRQSSSKSPDTVTNVDELGHSSYFKK